MYVCVCVRGYEVIDDVVLFAFFLSLENWRKRTEMAGGEMYEIYL